MYFPCVQLWYVQTGHWIVDGSHSHEKKLCVHGTCAYRLNTHKMATLSIRRIVCSSWFLLLGVTSSYLHRVFVWSRLVFFFFFTGSDLMALVWLGLGLIAVACHPDPLCTFGRPKRVSEKGWRVTTVFCMAHWWRVEGQLQANTTPCMGKGKCCFRLNSLVFL